MKLQFDNYKTYCNQNKFTPTVKIDHTLYFETWIWSASPIFRLNEGL